MSDPLTTEDLYGITPEKKEEKPPEVSLEYEETPVIDVSKGEVANPVKEVSSSQEPPKLGAPHELPRMKPKSHGFTNFLVFVLLFIAGIWLSSSLRQYLPSGVEESLGLSKTTPTALATPTGGDSARVSPAAVLEWKTYEVISGISKKPIDGVKFMLPPDVLSPICDGTGCASQGTYLPGGTRFTVAARGAGQSLRDYRGTAISDVNGVKFTTKAITTSGVEAMEFTGAFTGRTISGYAFATMRGVMIPLSPTTSLEINHFVPSGITADFASDDVLFDEILKKVVINATGGEKGAMLLVPTVTTLKIASPTTTVR